jgi:general nucleoside transport system ATP-binding protein
MPSEMVPPNAVEFCHVSKSFGTLLANDDLNFQIEAGTLHAIVGENGAGKSTAMNMLFGMFPCSKGELKIFGKTYTPHSPLDAATEGIGMVHQHFMLNTQETAISNFILSQEALNCKNILRSLVPLSFKFEKYHKQLAQMSMDFFGIPFPSNAKVQDLSMGERQRLEILKALAFQCKILILDEPTAVLSRAESDQLYCQLQSLTRDKGITILLVTHKLKDACAYASRATILRKGKMVCTLQAHELNVDALAKHMIDPTADLDLAEPTKHFEPSSETSEPIFQVESLSVQNADRRWMVNPLDFEICRGEILGIAGVEGNGQSEFIWALKDPERLREQGYKVTGQVLKSPKSDQIGFVPEDRHHDAICEELTASENLILGHETKFSRWFFLVKKWIQQNAQQLFAEFDIRPLETKAQLKQFSGGNQQKIVVAREISKNPSLIFAAHPTRGVDFAAAQILISKLSSIAEQKGAVLLVSSDLEELMGSCHRIYVMFSGNLMGPFCKPFQEETIAKAMGGIHP